MRRTPIVLASVMAVIGLLGVQASAAPKAVETTYYFHGGPNGNLAMLQAAATGGHGHLPMNRAKPTSHVGAEFGSGAAAGTPSGACVGDPADMIPTWTGKATGSLTKLVLNYYTRSLPGGEVNVRLFADLPEAVICGSQVPKPFAKASAGLPESLFAPLPEAVQNDLVQRGIQTVTFRFPHPVSVKRSFTVQLVPAPTLVPVMGSSVVFDGVTAASGVTWSCLPPKGKKTC